MITFSCECGKRYQVKDELAGKRAKCSCGKEWIIPQPAQTNQLNVASAPIRAEAPVHSIGSKLRGVNRPIRWAAIVGTAAMVVIFGTLGVWSLTRAKAPAENGSQTVQNAAVTRLETNKQSTPEDREPDEETQKDIAISATEKTALQKRLLGSWSAIGRSGILLSFNDQGRVSDYSIRVTTVADPGGFLLHRKDYSEGKVRYEVSPIRGFVKMANKQLPSILVVDSTTDSSISWAVEFVGDSNMILWGEFDAMEGGVLVRSPRSISFTKD